MSTNGLLLVGVVMALGVVGTFVPLLPGLPLIWAAGLVWALAEGRGVTRWVVLGVLTALLAVGVTAKYVLPGRAAAVRGAPWTSLAAGAIGAVVGFFLIPVVGVVVGGPGALLVAERARLGSWSTAWSTTRATLLALGVGMLVEFGTGLAMLASWLVAVLATR